MKKPETGAQALTFLSFSTQCLLALDARIAKISPVSMSRSMPSTAFFSP